MRDQVIRNANLGEVNISKQGDQPVSVNQGDVFSGGKLARGVTDPASCYQKSPGSVVMLSGTKRVADGGLSNIALVALALEDGEASVLIMALRLPRVPSTRPMPARAPPALPRRQHAASRTDRTAQRRRVSDDRRR